jgi:hypothetical protein
LVKAFKSAKARLALMPEIYIAPFYYFLTVPGVACKRSVTLVAFSKEKK